MNAKLVFIRLSSFIQQKKETARPVARILSRGGGAHTKIVYKIFLKGGRTSGAQLKFRKKLLYVNTCFQRFPHISTQTKNRNFGPFKLYKTIIAKKFWNIDHFCAFSAVCLFCLVVWSFFFYLQLKNFRFSSHQARALRPLRPPLATGLETA